MLPIKLVIDNVLYRFGKLKFKGFQLIGSSFLSSCASRMAKNLERENISNLKLM